ncbi:hypothetical protein ACF1BN_15930 [Streptomyces sp. NPDC014861]|uniref:hypothetical protein n=1 Tax=Streptomyces sp. NPDC014861 TaxID=3364923 RepID=UPI0037023289
MDIPDRVDVASMRTHRLVLAVALDGTAHLDTRLGPEGTARLLRSTADHLTDRPGECVHDLLTGGAPCPVHHTPPAPAAEPTDGGLSAHVTEYRVPVPEAGGMVLLVRRQSPTSGVGWAVSTTAYGGGRAWTTEGWQNAVSALSVGRLFCWPDAHTAVTEARRALAAQTVQGSDQ